MPVKAWIAVAAIAGTVVGGCGGGDGEQRRASKAEGSWPPKVAPGTIKTVVGTGRYGLGGLGGPANKTGLQLPIDLAFDDAGNLYIACRAHLDGTPCMAYISDMKVRVDEADAYFARNADIYRAVYKGPHNLLGLHVWSNGNEHAISRHPGARGTVREYGGSGSSIDSVGDALLPNTAFAAGPVTAVR